MVPPLLSCPSKWPPVNDSVASGCPLWSRIIRLSCSNVHFRLVKKLPGQPPSGATVPCEAPGASPSVMKQPPPAAAVKCQRPPRSTGGGEGGGGEGGGGAAAGGSGFVSDDAQAASPISKNKTAAHFAALLRPRCTRFCLIATIGIFSKGPARI